MSDLKKESVLSEWLKEIWMVGQYTPSDTFKQVENHSCVCRPSDMGLIALTGRAEDKESQNLADLISKAAKLLELARLQHNAMDLLFARLLQKDETFLPSKSGFPWDVMKKSSALLEQLKHLM